MRYMMRSSKTLLLILSLQVSAITAAFITSPDQCVANGPSFGTIASPGTMVPPDQAGLMFDVQMVDSGGTMGGGLEFIVGTAVPFERALVRFNDGTGSSTLMSTDGLSMTANCGPTGFGLVYASGATTSLTGLYMPSASAAFPVMVDITMFFATSPTGSGTAYTYSQGSIGMGMVGGDGTQQQSLPASGPGISGDFIDLGFHSGTPMNGGGMPMNDLGMPGNGGGMPMNGGGMPMNGGGMPMNGEGMPMNGGGMPMNGTPMSGMQGNFIDLGSYTGTPLNGMQGGGAQRPEAIAMNPQVVGEIPIIPINYVARPPPPPPPPLPMFGPSPPPPVPMFEPPPIQQVRTNSDPFAGVIFGRAEGQQQLQQQVMMAPPPPVLPQMPPQVLPEPPLVTNIIRQPQVAVSNTNRIFGGGDNNNDCNEGGKSKGNRSSNCRGKGKGGKGGGERGRGSVLDYEALASSSFRIEWSVCATALLMITNLL